MAVVPSSPTFRINFFFNLQSKWCKPHSTYNGKSRNPVFLWFTLKEIFVLDICHCKFLLLQNSSPHSLCRLYSHPTVWVVLSVLTFSSFTPNTTNIFHLHFWFSLSFTLLIFCPRIYHHLENVCWFHEDRDSICWVCFDIPNAIPHAVGTQ